MTTVSLAIDIDASVANYAIQAIELPVIAGYVHRLDSVRFLAMHAFNSAASGGQFAELFLGLSVKSPARTSVTRSDYIDADFIWALHQPFIPGTYPTSGASACYSDDQPMGACILTVPDPYFLDPANVIVCVPELVTGEEVEIVGALEYTDVKMTTAIETTLLKRGYSIC